MRVDSSLLDGIAAVHSAAKASSPAALKPSGTTTSFSSALKSAAEKETTKPVAGQPYAEITSGPRAGMYLNTSGNAHDGEAFVLVKHDGREDHIYGTGKDRKVVGVSTGASGTESAKSTDTKTASSTPAAGETSKPVAGHAYADILTGKRDGMFINTSGNVRDGDAFVLVKRNSREFHIYGTGKDRQVIGLKPKTDTSTAAPTTTTPPVSTAPSTSTAPTTTGTSVVNET
jgi:hypothetical protein